MTPRTPREDGRLNRLLLAGVFFTFAPGGLLFCLIQSPPATWSAGVIIATFSGLVAMAWAYAVSSRRFWLIWLIVPFSAIAPMVLFPRLGAFGAFDLGGSMSVPWRQATLIAMSFGMVSVGYVCTILFIRDNERRAERARTELAVAQDFHRTLVPELRLSTPLAEVWGRSDPSSEMGGDLIDAVTRPVPGVADGVELDVFLADVSGHGVRAGIAMGILKSSIRSLLRARPELGALTSDVNAVLAELTAPEMFATFACLRVRSADRIEYAIAGHLPIWVLRHATGAVDEIANEHLPLGVLRDEAFAAGSFPVAPGDAVVIVTDGLTEVADHAGGQLGLEALRSVLRGMHGRPLAEIADALFAAARAHGPQSDDQSVVLVGVAG